MTLPPPPNLDHIVLGICWSITTDLQGYEPDDEAEDGIDDEIYTRDTNPFRRDYDSGHRGMCVGSGGWSRGTEGEFAPCRYQDTMRSELEQRWSVGPTRC